MVSADSHRWAPPADGSHELARVQALIGRGLALEHVAAEKERVRSLALNERRDRAVYIDRVRVAVAARVEVVVASGEDAEAHWPHLYLARAAVSASRVPSIVRRSSAIVSRSSSWARTCAASVCPSSQARRCRDPGAPSGVGPGLSTVLSRFDMRCSMAAASQARSNGERPSMYGTTW